jgi:hypothetical protein
MIRAKGRYRNQAVQLDEPLEIAEDSEVLVDIHIRDSAEDNERRQWADLGMGRLEEDWDNPEDAIYDDWKKLYGA